jgi:hypothetical protein
MVFTRDIIEWLGIEPQLPYLNVSLATRLLEEKNIYINDHIKVIILGFKLQIDKDVLNVKSYLG